MKSRLSTRPPDMTWAIAISTGRCTQAAAAVLVSQPADENIKEPPAICSSQLAPCRGIEHTAAWGTQKQEACKAKREPGVIWVRTPKLLVRDSCLRGIPVGAAVTSVSIESKFARGVIMAVHSPLRSAPTKPSHSTQRHAQRAQAALRVVVPLKWRVHSVWGSNALRGACVGHAWSMLELHLSIHGDAPASWE